MTNFITNGYIGIDVSKTWLDVYILPFEKHIQFANNPKGISALINYLRILLVHPLIVMEATGGYEKKVARALVEAAFETAVINPRQIRDFAKAIGCLAKTDKIDAKVIALFAEKIQPTSRVLVDEVQQQVAENNARRTQIIGMITMEKNRLDKASPHNIKSINRIIKALETELKRINDSLNNLVQEDSPLKRKYDLLNTVNGVGQITAIGLIASLPELGKLTGKQITALAGLAPYNCDSGTLRGKRKIWGGRSEIRTLLYMATLTAIRHNPTIKFFYERLCAAGKLKKVAITACMHKLLIILNAIIKSDQPWHSEITA